MVEVYQSLWCPPFCILLQIVTTSELFCNVRLSILPISVQTYTVLVYKVLHYLQTLMGS